MKLVCNTFFIFHRRLFIIGNNSLFHYFFFGVSFSDTLTIDFLLEFLSVHFHKVFSRAMPHHQSKKSYNTKSQLIQNNNFKLILALQFSYICCNLIYDLFPKTLSSSHTAIFILFILQRKRKSGGITSASTSFKFNFFYSFFLISSKILKNSSSFGKRFSF